MTRPSADQLGLARTAHSEGLRAELLVSNYSSRLGDFDGRTAGRLLARPARITRLADTLAGYVDAGGWDGVNVDLESLRRADGPGLVSLLSQLRSRLPAPLSLTVDVQASTSTRDYVRSGYRLAEIAAQVDAVQLMAYDLHGPSWSRPGPIGPLTWQRHSLAVALSAVPAEKVDLGVAGYGYTWPARGTGRTVSVATARRLAARAGVTPRWRPAAGEWTARLPDGTRLWWADVRSFELRRQLATELGLHGLAMWRLGSTDTLTPPARLNRARWSSTARWIAPGRRRPSPGCSSQLRSVLEVDVDLLREDYPARKHLRSRPPPNPHVSQHYR